MAGFGAAMFVEFCPNLLSKTTGFLAEPRMFALALDEDEAVDMNDDWVVFEVVLQAWLTILK